MREICIKQTESTNHKRRNLSIVELIDQGGMMARAEKKFSYYVFEQNTTQDPAQLNSWMESQSVMGTKKTVTFLSKKYSIIKPVSVK